jgi:hypothetical protein
MKLLAKSILHPGQIAARRQLKCDGIEILLLGNDFKDISLTKAALRETAQEYPVVGLEAPDSVDGMPVYPLSPDSTIAHFSREFLARCIELAHELTAKTNAEVYFQYQYCGSPAHPNTPFRSDYESDLEAMANHYSLLQRSSNVPIQMENGTPIAAAYDQEEKLYARTVSARMSDFADTNIPLALDIVHLAETLYTWSQAKQDNCGWFVETKRGRMYFPAVEEDIATGYRLAKQHDLRTAITDQIILEIKSNADRIGSLQFANAQAGFALEHENEGHAGADGIIDVARVMKEAIIPANIPYVIPEYRETDYLDPVHQRAAARMVRELSAK